MGAGGYGCGGNVECGWTYCGSSRRREVALGKGEKGKRRGGEEVAEVRTVNVERRQVQES